MGAAQGKPGDETLHGLCCRLGLKRGRIAERPWTLGAALDAVVVEYWRKRLLTDQHSADRMAS